MSNISFDTIKAASANYFPNKEEQKFELSKFLAVVFESKWLIAFITALTLALGVAKALLENPTYKAELMLQIESNSQSLGALEPIADLINNKKPILTEIEIIKSKFIMGEVINKLSLDIVAEPKYFPIIGGAIARNFQKNNHGTQVSDPLFHQSQYAWGGEAIQIDTLAMPARLLETKLTLVAGEKGRYKLMHGDMLLLEGAVGKLSKATLPDSNEEMGIFVSLLRSRPSTQFVVKKLANDLKIDDLRRELLASEKGKGTGILGLSIEDHNPELAARILNETANTYMRGNVENKSAEANKKLQFLEQQLPIVKEQMDIANSAYNNYRSEKGSVDLEMETQDVLKNVTEIKTQMTLLTQKNEELRQKFTEAHPSVVSINKQLSHLAMQMRENEKKIGVLPETQQVIVGLSKEVQVNTAMYNTLLNEAQTLRVAKAGTVGDIRVIDSATAPSLPISPKKALIVIVSFILGLVLGIMAAFIRKSLRHGVEDPNLIESNFNIPVYASLPHSPLQAKVNKKLKRLPKDEKAISILALENKEDLAIESLRSLRTTLHFAFLEAKSNVIMITGPSPGIGKSFVSVNLATVLAEMGKRILLIDGDLRKGLIFKSLGVTRENGLSELISSVITIDQARHTIPVANFDFIATGMYPPNPSELLLHERLGKFLEDISKHYDHVIIDSPPVLAVTDAAIIGRMASVTLMVVKSGQHPMRELEQSVKRLEQAGVKIKGFIFNDVPETASPYGFGQYVYQYSYQKSK